MKSTALLLTKHCFYFFLPLFLFFPLLFKVEVLPLTNKINSCVMCNTKNHSLLQQLFLGRHIFFHNSWCTPVLLGHECCSDAFFPGGKAERGKTEGMWSVGKDGTGGRWEVLAHGLYPCLAWNSCTALAGICWGTLDKGAEGIKRWHWFYCSEIWAS